MMDCDSKMQSSKPIPAQICFGQCFIIRKKELGKLVSKFVTVNGVVKPWVKLHYFLGMAILTVSKFREVHWILDRQMFKWLP